MKAGNRPSNPSQALDEIAKFVRAIEGKSKETPTLPVEALDVLIKGIEKIEPEMTYHAVHNLVVLAKHSDAPNSEYGSGMSPIEELRFQHSIVKTIATLAVKPETAVPFLIEMLGTQTHSKYDPQAGGKRGVEFESIQDSIAVACMEGLVRFREAAKPALDAIDKASKHRSLDVRRMAFDVGGAIRYY
ncbi:hypothetical protein KAI87_06165 [Myxococcota bacterium]|nr:hypothetical protein [Myxococcota bacterium]